MDRLFLTCMLSLSIWCPASASDSSDGFSVTDEFARAFSSEWIDAWNSRDLPRILSHYDDDFEMSSPLIVTLMGEPSGTLKGKEAIGKYWELALSRAPDLHFELQHFLTGASSLIIIYHGARGLTAEYFEFSRDGGVAASAAHYINE